MSKMNKEKSLKLAYYVDHVNFQEGTEVGC